MGRESITDVSARLSAPFPAELTIYSSNEEAPTRLRRGKGRRSWSQTRKFIGRHNPSSKRGGKRFYRAEDFETIPRELTKRNYNLWSHVVLQAAKDMLGISTAAGKLVRYDLCPYEYFLCDRKDVGSFQWICDHINLDPELLQNLAWNRAVWLLAHFIPLTPEELPKRKHYWGLPFKIKRFEKAAWDFISEASQDII